MQTFRSFILHGCAECVALDVVSEQRTEEHRNASRNCDYKENPDRGGNDQ
jgi:hypothetical protein